MTTYSLFAKPSFLRGLGSIGNLSGTIIYNQSDTSVEADVNAIKSDWEQVGKDLEESVVEYGK